MDERSVYIYGPVASRRLGSSLGVDLVPRKTCDYDCVYCQLGRTTDLTTSREPYVPSDAVLEQLERKLNEYRGIDYITLAGSGEPTLNSELGAIITGIRRISELPIAVITNGSLLFDDDVAAACAEADLVIPSLDAADEKTFQAVNRPCAGLSMRDVVEGIVSFRELFKGRIWLEVMVVRGLNDGADHAERLRALVDRISPDKVQLNTVTRPPADPDARPVESGELEALGTILESGAEVIGSLAYGNAVSLSGFSTQRIRELTRRRPCTVDDVAKALDLNSIEAVKLLAHMEEKGMLSSMEQGGRRYYMAL